MMTFNFVGLGAPEIIVVFLLLCLLFVFAFLKLVTSDLQPIGKVLWVVFMLFIPIVGPVVFLIYNGYRKKDTNS